MPDPLPIAYDQTVRANPSTRSPLYAALALTLVLGAGLGALIAVLAVEDAPAASEALVPAATTGHLEVVSVPEDGTVTVDGRLVGLTPIDRLDLEPGKHAVVIEVFAYQPYVGTVTVVSQGNASLEAHLAPVGGEGSTQATFHGKGAHQARVLPRPANPPASQAPASKPSKASKPGKRRRQPDPPRRDCSGEHSSCKSKCDSAAFSCRSSCQYCGSCVTTTMTWDECNRICNTCRQGCEQNEKFCESSCDHQYDSCQ